MNRVGGDLRDPSVVPAKGATKLHGFGHFERFELNLERNKNERTEELHVFSSSPWEKKDESGVTGVLQRVGARACVRRADAYVAYAFEVTLVTGQWDQRPR